MDPLEPDPSHRAGGPVEVPLAPGLYLVSTPIGNLRDMTLRALDVLASCDRILCEDTRVSPKLLQRYGIRKPLRSLHLHNEGQQTEQVLEELREGGRIALISDAGTPAISDPGQALVQAVRAAGLAVVPIPGASAVLAALVASGLPTDRFSFNGFLPSRSGERRTALERVRDLLLADPGRVLGTQIWFESPHRIRESLADLIVVFGAGQRAVLARELTKVHEEFLSGTLQEIADTVEKRGALAGELVIVLDAAERPSLAASTTSVAFAVQALIQSESLDDREAVKRVARDRGLARSEVYREWQRARSK